MLKPETRRGKVTLGAVVALVVVTVGFTASSTMERRREVQRLEMLRDSISTLRSKAELCQAAVTDQAASFKDFDAGVDSLRTEARAFESEEQGRVPAAEYEAYLDAVRTYNRSVLAWRGQAAELESRSEECRALFVRHNVLVDSLRLMLSGP